MIKRGLCFSKQDHTIPWMWYEKFSWFILRFHM